MVKPLTRPLSGEDATWPGTLQKTKSQRDGVKKPLTALQVQDVMVIQRPAAQTGGVELEPLQCGAPPLPENHARARLVLEAHGHCRTQPP